MRKAEQLGILVALGLISTGAFSRPIAKLIGKRDRWTCVQTGRRFKDGWLVDVAHYDHRRNERYNSPENGRVLCRSAHLQEHLTKYKQYGDPKDLQAAKLIAKRSFRTGLRKVELYERDPELLEQDRTEVVMILENNGIDARDIIDFENDALSPSDIRVDISKK